jgi:hypothetical protein
MTIARGGRLAGLLSKIFFNHKKTSMQTLQIDPATAKALYRNASNEFKVMLRDTFGEKFFIEKITDRIKSFQDACEVLRIHEDDIMQDSDSADEQAYKKLKVICKALNEGWQPNWQDQREYKYYPWFKMSGSGLSCRGYGYYCSGSGVGSRLCFESGELAKYAGEQFVLIYSDFMTI